MLLGETAMDRLRESHVAVFGLGGVGSWCAEALARSGVGKLTLVDQDTVGESNINRQLIAADSSLGKPKAEVIARASGVSLGQVVSVSEGYQDMSVAYTQDMPLANYEEKSADGGLADVEPGEVTVEAEVTVSYALR